MPPKNDDVPVDIFMRSLLKAAKDRGIALVAIYGFNEGGRNVMKMSSTEGEAATRAALSWVFKANQVN
jgi:hypothetical protein